MHSKTILCLRRKNTEPEKTCGWCGGGGGQAKGGGREENLLNRLKHILLYFFLQYLMFAFHMV